MSKQVSFGEAVEAMKAGKRVQRLGWNGQGMFAYYVPAASYPVQTGAAKAHFGEGALVPYRAYLALKTAQGDVATWAPSCSDCLAEDWVILDEAAPTFLDRLKAELAELTDRRRKLRAFLSTTPFKKLSQRQQELLLQQHEHMVAYELTLDTRLAVIQKEG